MATIDELTTLIEKAIVEKTFSLDGAKAIAELRSKYEALEARYEACKKERDELSSTNRKWENDYKTLQDLTTKSREGFEKKIGALEFEAASQRVAVIGAAFEKDRREDLFRLTEIIFRNPHVRTLVRREASENIPTVDSYGKPTIQRCNKEEAVTTTTIQMEPTDSPNNDLLSDYTRRRL